MALSKFLDPKNDVAFRKIFGTEEHKDILIHFINDILELKEGNQIKEITFISPIQNPAISCKKESVVDVLCRDASGIEIIVEMQVTPTEGFEKRAQYYAAKAYSNQLKKGKAKDGRYENLKEVIFIAIINYHIFPNKTALKSDYVILDRATNEHDLKDFKFTFLVLPNLKKKKIEELETIIEKWCYFFKYADETSEADMVKIGESYKTISEAYEAVNQFNWTPEQLIAYEDEKKRIADNRSALRYQLEKVEKEALEKGMEQGIEVGIQKGKAEAAMNMLQFGIPKEDIVKITGLTRAEIDNFCSSKS